MASTPINLIQGDESGTETDYRNALSINMSGILRPLFGAKGYMLQQPGLTQYGEGVGVDRGGVWNPRLINHFRVSGTSFIEVDADGVSTTLGAISGTDTVTLPYSFNTQGIVADGRFYLYDPIEGFREVTDPDLGDPIDAVWVDGYYFFTDGDFIYHTDIDDEEEIDPLKFATAEFQPDPSNGVGLTPDNKVIVFGRYTIEYFINIAQANFAFTRVPSRAVKAGIVGTHAKAEMLDRWYILGGRKEEAVSVHAVGVGSVTNVSSREVDKVIGTYDENQLSTAVLEARVEDKYQYLIIHLPNDTLIYNARVGEGVDNEYAWSILKTDDRPFVPTEITKLSLWADASDEATVIETSSDVSLWKDKSNESNDLPQGTTLNQPDYLIADINGLNTISWDGVDDALVNTSPTPLLSNLFNSGGTFFAVIKPQSDGEGSLGRIIDWDGVASIFVSDESAGDLRFSLIQEFSTNNGEWETTDRDLTNNTPFIIAISYDANSMISAPTFYVNSSEVSVTQVSVPAGTVNSDFDAQVTAGNRVALDRTFDGSIGEILTVKSTLLIEQINLVFNYLSDKWNI